MEFIIRPAGIPPTCRPFLLAKICCRSSKDGSRYIKSSISEQGKFPAVQSPYFCSVSGNRILQSVTIQVTLNRVIRAFKHKGLERFFSTGSKAGIQAQHADRLRLILGRLNAAATPQDMNLPGLALHQLKGARKGTWAVQASGNWRITFTFVGKDADAVDYEDYH